MSSDAFTSSIPDSSPLSYIDTDLAVTSPDDSSPSYSVSSNVCTRLTANPSHLSYLDIDLSVTQADDSSQSSYV